MVRLGCFYDTVLDEAREVCGEMVVSGPCEAALKIASTLSDRLPVIIGVEKWKVQIEDTVHLRGYGEKLVSVRELGVHVDSFQKNPAKTAEAIRRAAKEAVEIDKAEAIILGCTMEFGFLRHAPERTEGSGHRRPLCLLRRNTVQGAVQVEGQSGVQHHSAG